jgi:methylated-DNA-protein-cysteine methyltransferase-like protein
MVLRYLDTNKYLEVPWWRVINSKGEITIKGNWTATKEMQRDMLLKDGIKVNDGYKINMEKYQWKK